MHTIGHKERVKWENRAKHRIESAFPTLWPVAGYDFSLANTGDQAFDLSGRGNNLTISGATWISDALRFVAVETDYAQVNKCPFITYPFSLCCRFRPTGTSDGVLIWVGDKDSTGDYSELTARGIVLNVRAFTATTGGSGADSGATGTTDYVLNAWHTAAAVFESQSLRKVYLDGALDATDTTTVGTSNAYDRMGIGARLDASPSAFSDCDISHVAIYNRVLTAGEVQQIDIDSQCWQRKRRRGICAAISAGTLLTLAGTIAAQSGITGDIGSTKALIGVITGQAAASGNISALKKLAGIIEAQVNVAGNVKLLADLAGIITAQAGASGDISAAMKLAGTIAAQSAVSGNITIKDSWALAAAIVLLNNRNQK